VTATQRGWLVGAIVIAALAFLIWKGLGNATVYFKTADEAVAQRASLGTRTFRIEGIVVPNSVHDAGSATAFTIENKAVNVNVIHRGNQPALFRPGIPVVLEGHWAKGANRFESDKIMVKHTSDYRTKNPSRVTDYSQ
jgi:cytochrome c-type biogenesis protein CcmE